MRFLKRTALFFVLSLLVTAFAQAENTENSLFNYISQQELPELRIELDFDTLLAHKKTDEYQDVKVTLHDGTVWEAKAKPRGRYRRRICDFPPVKIDFSKDDLAEAGFAEYDDLKFANYCYDNAEGKDWLLREYLAYQLFASLTPRSFRTQLIEVTYINTGKGGPKKMKQYAILLEDDEEMAARLGGTQLEQFNTKWDALEATQASLVAGFQYMIGNTDWSVDVRHNVKLLQVPGEEELYLIPYDFDFSGLVNADYAVPDNRYSITNVRQRHYMAPQLPSTALCSYLKTKKEELLQTCKDFKLLSRESRLNVIAYLQDFYEELENGEAFAMLERR